MRKSSYVSLLLLMIVTLSGYGQNSKFEEKAKKDGVSIYYKWSHQNPVDKNSPLQMVFKMVNENDEAVNVTFDVNYYLEGILKETNGVKDFCIKGGKTANGRFNGLVFSTANISNAQIASDVFDWELSNITILKIDECPDKK